MSALASSFVASNNSGSTLLQQTKTSSKTDDPGFLSILEAGNLTNITQDVGTSLVDTLYDRDEVPEPSAVPVQVPTQLFVDNKKSGEDIEPKTSAPHDDVRDNVIDVPERGRPAQQDKSNKADAVEKKADDVAPISNKVNAASEPKKTTSSQEATPAKPVTEGETLSELSEKISDRIAELSALLSSIAALFASKMQGASQLNITKVSVQVRAVGSNFASAADALNAGLNSAAAQLNKLLAFIQGGGNTDLSAESNVLNANAFDVLQTTSSLTLQSVNFESIDFNGASWQKDCAACDVKLGQFISLMQSNKAEFATNNFSGEEISSFADMFAQLKQDLGDLRKLLHQRAAVLSASTTNSADVLPVTTASTDALPAASDNLLAPVVTSITSPVVDNKTTQQQWAVTNSSGVVVAQENATSNNSLAGGNSQSQGGDRGFSPAPLGSVAGSQAASQTHSLSFSKLLAQSSHIPVLEQVAVHIKTLPKDGSSKIDIQLDPESLGKVQIKMSVDSDGNTNLTVTADNKQTLDLLQRDSRGLQQALNDAGLKTDGGSLSFNLRGGEQQKEQQASSTYQKLQPEEEDLAPLAMVSRSYVVNMHDGLNIEI